MGIVRTHLRNILEENLHVDNGTFLQFLGADYQDMLGCSLNSQYRKGLLFVATYLDDFEAFQCNMLPYVSDSEILALLSEKEDFNFFRAAESFMICSYIVRNTAQWPNLIHGCEVLKPQPFVQHPPWPYVSLLLTVDKTEYIRLGYTESVFKLESKISSFHWYQTAFNLAKYPELLLPGPNLSRVIMDPKLSTVKTLARIKAVGYDKELAVEKEDDPEFDQDETKPNSSMRYDTDCDFRRALDIPAVDLRGPEELQPKKEDTKSKPSDCHFEHPYSLPEFVLAVKGKVVFFRATIALNVNTVH
ncbi:hypothetical protein CRM22_005871 [Opisthorchis felineus]|uniref:Uncharacterized protein n=1 Tax=Opisthorchis felineus TaxID=147828 RepID=A0A4S2LP20_OPIFE|nr:hypothetical protein CRM22_005871 [Opisthorchis felineus]